MDAKRQNKLLKLAIGRLQSELEKKEGYDESQMPNNQNVKVFLTENQNQQAETNQMTKDKYLEILRGDYNGGLGNIQQ